MNRQDRRNAIIVAVIAAVAVIVAALFNGGIWKKEAPRPVPESKTENRAETKDAQSPAVDDQPLPVLGRLAGVLALNALQKSIILTPCGPRAVPTGGAGVALPSGICNFTCAVTANV
jgi:hypothetical protein